MSTHSGPAHSMGDEPNFSTADVRGLSPSRVAAVRLPDLLQEMQRKCSGHGDKRIGEIFLAYIQESEYADPDGLVPLSITNDVDSESSPSVDFAYTDSYILGPGLPKERLPDGLEPGCNCTGDECDPKTCLCAAIGPVMDKTYIKDEFKKPSFVYQSDGRLAPGPRDYPGTPIWECNDWCGCSDSCPNRVVQKGRKLALDIFKTKTRGWGVRTMEPIAHGTFIIHYAGELVTSEEEFRRAATYDRALMSYVMDLDSEVISRHQFREPFERKIRQEKGKAELRRLKEDPDAFAQMAAEAAPEAENLFSTDAGLWGNISRYFNSSCNPNMKIWPVYTTSRDVRRPFFCFFAQRAIKVGEELTFTYAGEPDEDEETNEKKDLRQQLQDAPEGTNLKVKAGLSVLECKCGDAKCSGLLFRTGKL